MLLTNDLAMKRLEGIPGDIGLVVYEMATGDRVSIGETKAIEAASVIKLFVMAEAFRQREEGLIDFAMPVTVREEDKLPSCGALTYMKGDITLPLGDLVTLMIILSDNTATNLLIDLMGIGRIGEMISLLGMRETALRRKLFMPELAARGVRNEVSARDCARLMQLLLEGRVVSPGASAEMLDMLRCQRLRGKMPFYLSSRNVKCAHKTGEDDGITHDVGVIFGKTPRIFCFLSQKTNVPEAERALQALAGAAGTDDMQFLHCGWEDGKWRIS